MQILIRKQPVDILVNTVTLANIPTDEVFLFRCYKCGTGIAQVKGKMSGIYAGHIPSSIVPVINLCYKCHEYYIFQTWDFPLKKYVNLSLYNNTINRSYADFYCPICRTQLFQYNGHSVIISSTSTDVNLPYTFSCFNPLCAQKYRVAEVI